MAKPTIFVTRQLPGNALSRLKKIANVRIWNKDEKIPRKELLKNVKDIDGLLPLLTEKIDGEIMDRSQNLRIIANYAVGFDNIDLKAATERGIYVTNAPGDNISNSVAEFSLALILNCAKRVAQADPFTRAGKYKAWSPTLFLGGDLKGRTLGIIGVGRIGSRLAEMLAEGFGVKILYTDIVSNKDIEKRLGAKRVRLETLLKRSDFVSLHVPLNESTHHLISTKELRLMKKTAYLINTARGPVVDELALIKALKRGDIKYAALDVYECEPSIDCNVKDNHELRELENIVLTPHIASASFETRAQMADIAVDNLIDVLKRNRKPRTLVNKEVKAK